MLGVPPHSSSSTKIQDIHSVGFKRQNSKQTKKQQPTQQNNKPNQSVQDDPEQDDKKTDADDVPVFLPCKHIRQVIWTSADTLHTEEAFRTQVKSRRRSCAVPL